MGFKEQLMEDYKEAMKAGDAVKKETVNMVRAAIKQHEVDTRTELTDADIVKVIKKQVKMITDAIDEFVKAGRNDMIDAYNKEVEILKQYLPEEMSASEIVKKVKEIAEKTGLTEGMQHMGALMKECMKELSDVADGSAVNKAVKEFHF